MKNLKITLLTLLISVASFAQQGIVFQGIARDNNSAAITDQTMTFTFRITKKDGSDLYQETQQIKTDNFGVFSHIIGTGNAVTGTFAEVDYQLPDLKSIISVNYKGVDTQIYDQPFQYVPYAKAAGNGVPVGTVVPFLGDNPPKGWLLCDGQSITDSKYDALRKAIGNLNKLPDLRGRFLKGAGVSPSIPITEYDEAGIREYQNQSIMRHYHDKGSLSTSKAGNHSHPIRLGKWHRSFAGSDTGEHTLYFHSDWDVNDVHSGNWNRRTQDSGDHTHQIEGATSWHGTEENRPWTYTVNYIIKY